MIDRRPRSSYESDWLPYTKVTARSAVRAAIGQMLSSRYEVTQDVPREMLALLRQVDGCAKAGSSVPASPTSYCIAIKREPRTRSPGTHILSKSSVK